MNAPFTAMDIERAEKIVGECIAHVLFRMGVTDEPPPSLAEYSLQELIDANRRVAEENDKQPTTGRRTIRMKCDDRLIAALYVAYHYDANDPADGVEPIVLLPGGKAVCVAMTKEAA